MSEPVNPVSVENAMRETVDRISKGVRIVSDAMGKAQASRRVYDQAYARAYLAAEGPAHEKRYQAELATAGERETAEVDEQSYDHSRRLARALEKELDALRSIGVSVRSMYEGTRS
ncbi:MAG: hypothetical protein ACRDQA_05805 [Nocardioidaceae bacterium]